MGQATSIVINDGQATPVAVTFAPELVASGQASFTDRTAGVALGFRRMRINSSFSSAKSTVNRAKLIFEYPVTQTVNGVTSVAYTLRASLETILPDGCTTAERNNLYAFIKNGLANTLVQGALRDLDPIY